jgi:hypothetical protein
MDIHIKRLKIYISDTMAILIMTLDISELSSASFTAI